MSICYGLFFYRILINNDLISVYQVYKYEMTIWETDGAPMQCTKI